MANNNDGMNDALEGQIGAMGAENDSPKSLGKLQNADAILGTGNKGLNDDEQKSLDAFIARSNKSRDDAEDGIKSFNDISGGWVPIERERMGLRNNFYPESWNFRVRPANVEAIKNWSTIDDQNPYQVNQVFNEIIKQCVSIQGPNGAISWQKINSWDRFWFMLLVREYTFAKGENEISYDEECIECGNSITYKLNADSLYYDFPDEEVIYRNWNKEDKCWYINPADFDVPNMGMMKLFCPTLEKDDMILSWAIKQTQDHHEPSQALLKFLPWLVERASKDDDNAKRIIDKAVKIFNSWNTEQFTFMDEVLRNIVVTPNQTLKQVCPHCGEEVHSSVRFPDGVRALFSVQNRFTKFGSK